MCVNPFTDQVALAASQNGAEWQRGQLQKGDLTAVLYSSLHLLNFEQKECIIYPKINT